MLPQFVSKPKISKEDIEYGMERIMWGLVKKLVFAHRFALFVNPIYESPEKFSEPVLWLATIAFALQIYLDFSSYSDIAIGTARMFGIRLMENFRWPYLSRNISEFWQRWHIRLSSWIRDYVYISLGGSRGGLKKIPTNLVLVMFLAGLWHRAAWHFVVWGLYLGSCLIVYHILHIIRKTGDQGKSVSDSAVMHFLSVVFTFLVITIGWVFFRADNISDAFLIINKMLSDISGLENLTGVQKYFLCFSVFVLLMHIVRGSGMTGFAKRSLLLDHAIVKGIRLFLYTLLIILFSVKETKTFIYFRF